MPKLTTLSGPTRGRSYTLDELCILGRSPKCQVYIGDLTVSREHARIVRDARGWRLEDLGSGNGSYVNQARVTQAELQNGDEIRIGDCSFRFLDDEEPSSKWVNMVTVLAGHEQGLVHTVTEARRSSPSLEGYLTDVDLRADLARAQRMLETLYEVTSAISTILEPKALFDQILDALFKIFRDAERGFIMLLDDNQQLIPTAIRRRRSDGQSGGLVVSQSVVAQVMEQGKSVLSTSSQGRGSKMCAPLTAQGRTLGILLIEGRPEGRAFTQEDMDLLNGIAMQAGVAIMNAHMHQLLLRQQRLEQDMQFAKQVQRSFLPSEPPEVPGFLFGRRYNPVFEIGGDFYDFVPLPGQRIGILIGDVSGKGVSAALLMARLTSDMRYFAISESSPARVLARANAALISAAQDNMFATVLYLVLDVTQKTLHLSNAGHIPPLLRRTGGQVVPIEEATNLALGVLPDAIFDEHSLPLEVGDSVLLCTDGVVEAKSPAQEEYGLNRLRQAIAPIGPETLLDAVLKDLLRHTGGSSQYDDITLVSFARMV